jgi:hypothetical protein
VAFEVIARDLGWAAVPPEVAALLAVCATGELIDDSDAPTDDDDDQMTQPRPLGYV